MAIVAAAGTAAALVVHYGPKLARLAFTNLDGKKSQAQFDAQGLNKQVDIVLSGDSTPTPQHRR